MFQSQYIIQFSTVFVVFILWFISSFVLRFRQYSMSKSRDSATVEDPAVNTQEQFRSAIAAERTLLDGFLLLSVGVILNSFGQGNRTTGDVLSLITMFLLFGMTVCHYSGRSNWSFGIWTLISLALFAYYIVPFATNAVHIGYFNNAYYNTPPSNAPLTVISV